MAVFQMRRHMAETPRYLLASGQHKEFGEATAELIGAEATAPGAPGAERKPCGKISGRASAR
jgi:hypothetical protein